MAESEMVERARIAEIIADMFAAAVCRDDRDYGRRSLYTWEHEAIDWLRAWRKTDPDSLINAWTQNFVDRGPPPWRNSSAALSPSPAGEGR